jgi:hypothetical protein
MGWTVFQPWREQWARAAISIGESNVVRSTRFQVYFSSSDYLLVRTAADGNADSTSELKDAPLYELRKEVIRVIQWCAN